MCCHACSGYETCQTKSQLRDDCCTQCRYFDSCMEIDPDEQIRTKPNTPKKKKYVKTS